MAQSDTNDYCAKQMTYLKWTLNKQHEAEIG